MKTFTVGCRLFVLIVVSLLLFSGGSSVLAQDPDSSTNTNAHPSAPIVARVYFESIDDLAQLASFLDIWEVNHEAGYLVAMLTPQQYVRLQQTGYRLVIDQAKTELLTQQPASLPDQTSESIPGYSCYRTVEATYSSMQDIAAAQPHLVVLHDFGDSWDKITAGGPVGYDLYALELSNQEFGVPSTKPTFFLMAEIHAREYVTAETAMRFAEYLINNYGSDPDITWLLDYFRIYIVPMTNPDGRKFAEQGILWRKNTDSLAGGDCFITDYGTYGVDLNRNHGFHWGAASSDPCVETYQGPQEGSEPETQAIQNLIGSLYSDQRGPADADTAPLTSTGTLLTLHSYQQLVLWPWGWTDAVVPNEAQLQTLGRHLAYFNSYTPQQAFDLYPTSGTSDDWSYGVLGLASYTIEMGTSFFQSCSSFESTVYPDNRAALLYAFKTARRPYMDPAGPDSLNISVTPSIALIGSSVSLTATANDTRYNDGTEPTQNISAARYSIDNPSWITDTVIYTMTASDGGFTEKIEDVQAILDTSDLTIGQHIIFVESQDANGSWGVPSAVFLNIVPLFPQAEFNSNSPVQLGLPVVFSNQTTGLEPMTYAWDFGDGVGTSNASDPMYTYPSSGDYTVILTATNQVGMDTVTHTVTIFQPEITRVDLTQVTSDPLIRGDAVKFSADLTPDTGNSPYTYTIDFGDGNESGMATMEPFVIDHAFKSPGLYKVQVWIKNASMNDPVTDSLEVTIMTRIFLPLSVK